MQPPSLADFAHLGAGQMAAYVKARSQHDYQARKLKRAQLRETNQLAAEHQVEQELQRDVDQHCTSNVVASYIIERRREQVTCVRCVLPTRPARMLSSEGHVQHRAYLAGHRQPSTSTTSWASTMVTTAST